MLSRSADYYIFHIRSKFDTFPASAKTVIFICDGYIPIANENSRIYGSRLWSYLEVAIEANRKRYWSIARIGRLSDFQRWPQDGFRKREFSFVMGINAGPSTWSLTPIIKVSRTFNSRRPTTISITPTIWIIARASPSSSCGDSWPRLSPRKIKRSWKSHWWFLPRLLLLELWALQSMAARDLPSNWSCHRQREF